MWTLPLDPFDRRTWDEDERRYFHYVDEALARREDKVISNGRVEHAAYIIHKFLTHAESKVRLYSGKLSRRYNGFRVFDNDHVIQAAKKFLAHPGCELMIAIESGVDVESGESVADHPFVRAIEEAHRSGQIHGRLEIRQAPEAGKTFLQNHNFRNHWMVMDDAAYRLETNTGQAGAHVNFNDRKMARALALLFDRFLYRDGRHEFHIGPEPARS